MYTIILAVSTQLKHMVKCEMPPCFSVSILGLTKVRVACMVIKHQLAK